MTEKLQEIIMSGICILSFCFVVSIPYFWITSCQRTEIIKACLQYVDQNKKQECFKND